MCGEDHHLRLFHMCGFVGCRESKEDHDRDHFRETGPPLIRPHRQDDESLWYYGRPGPT